MARSLPPRGHISNDGGFMIRFTRPLTLAGSVAVLGLALTACGTNPVTGKRETRRGVAEGEMQAQRIGPARAFGARPTPVIAEALGDFGGEGFVAHLQKRGRD